MYYLSLIKLTGLTRFIKYLNNKIINLKFKFMIRVITKQKLSPFYIFEIKLILFKLLNLFYTNQLY